MAVFIQKSKQKRLCAFFNRKYFEPGKDETSLHANENFHNKFSTFKKWNAEFF